MSFLIVDQYGAFIGKKSGRLRVKVKGELKEEVPIINLEQVLVVAGGVSLSSDAIRICAEAGIPIHFVSRWGKPYAQLVSAGLIGTVKTRREQLLAYTDRRGVMLGKAFAWGKLLNQANLLKYMGKYRKKRDQDLYQEVQTASLGIQTLAHQVEDLKGQDVSDIRPQLLNLEGRGASTYWQAVKKLLLTDAHFPGREHREAQDVTNVCLNYGYGILYGQVEHVIVLAGLDPYGGFIHVDRPGKPSLVLDLIEEFRQMVVDRTVFGLLNRGTKIILADGRLEDASRRLLAEKVLARLEGKEPFEGKKHKLRTILHVQARHVATFVRGERRAYEPFVGRW